MRKGQVVSGVRVEELGPDALGSARVDGVDLLVAGACPGDVVDLEIAHVSHHQPRAWCEIARVTSRGEIFVEPACGNQWPVRGECGGCPAMHVDPAAMGAAKEGAVAAALLARGRDVEVDWNPSGVTLGYRNRGQYVVARRGGRVSLGSYAPRSHRVAPMDGCPVAREPIAETAAALEEVLAGAGVPIHPEPAGVRYVTIRSCAEGRALVDIVITVEAPGWLDSLADEIVAVDGVDGVSCSVNPGGGNAIRTAPSSILRGAGTCIEEVGGVRLELEASSFSQLNSEVAGRMYRAAAEAFGAPRVVWDLYCGAGGLGLTVAAASPGAKLYGADSVPRSIELAAANADRAGVAATHEAIDLSERGPGGWPRPDLILANPPRRGLDPPILERLASTEAGALIYMSCNPASFARDFEELASSGWRLDRVEAHDMLPGTAHVEILAALSR